MVVGGDLARLCGAIVEGLKLRGGRLGRAAGACALWKNADAGGEGR